MKKINDLKLRNKLLLSYMVIIVIPILILGLYAYSQARKLIVEEARTRIVTSLSQYTNTINGLFERYNTIVTFLAHNQQIHQVLGSGSNSYFEQYISYRDGYDPLILNTIATNQDILSIVAYSNNPNLTERYNSVQRMTALSQKPWFPQVMSDHQIHWYAEPQSLVSAIRLPALSKDSYTHVITVSVPYRPLTDNWIADNTGVLLITGTDDQPVYSIDPMGLKPQLNRIAQLSEMQAMEQGYIYIQQTVQSVGWKVYYCIPLDQIGMDINRILVTTLAIAILCFIMLLILTLVFSRTFSRRITHLQQKMLLVQNGNLTVEMEAGARDEIGQLTSSFVFMVNKLRLMLEEERRHQDQLKEMELRALQAQIKPHFLYNTLSVINWKAIFSGNQEISQLTQHLATYYRGLLGKGGDLVTVRQEVAEVASYTSIQEEVHKGKFTIHYSIASEIQDCLLPRLTIQPVVENAIEHGVLAVESLVGTIHIRGYAIEQNVVFDICDNGCGMDLATQTAALAGTSESYGISNVHHRLQLLYGPSYGLTICSQPGEGTTVTVTLPQMFSDHP